MRAHIIEGGVVVNTVEVGSLDDLPGFELIEAEEGGCIGDAWNGEAFTTPEPVVAPPVRRLIPKDLIMDRLDGVGLVDTAQAALLRRPVLFGRWFNKDWSEVYADDAELVAILTAIGADVETITAP